MNLGTNWRFRLPNDLLNATGLKTFMKTRMSNGEGGRGGFLSLQNSDFAAPPRIARLCAKLTRGEREFRLIILMIS